ncbi:DUF4913 domain-containing protein [Streptomyces sp. NPDC050085]|uniref:DUF4913 domain-containing protein n=1 Tax=Streptomyces sp. NPDC050085 TaxID=3365600 RepID=UPI00379FC51B
MSTTPDRPDETQDADSPEAVPDTVHDDEDLADDALSALSPDVRRLMDRSAAQARLLAGDDDDLPLSAYQFAMPTPARVPRPILTLDGDAYDSELQALAAWVNDFLLPTYGREVTTAHPWCPQWTAHLEVVARLHALWLSYQQQSDAEAGPSGMAVWHRDFLDHTMAAVRAADGPLAACMTNPDRPAHRLLPTPVTTPPSLGPAA